MDRSIFCHLALPERLPHSENADLDEIEAGLIDRALVSACRMQNVAAEESNLRDKASHAWECIRLCLLASKCANRRGRVSKRELLSEIASMTVPGALLLYIRSQNAALLVHRGLE
jgi:hypothetical protein